MISHALILKWKQRNTVFKVSAVGCLTINSFVLFRIKKVLVVNYTTLQFFGSNHLYLKLFV